MLNARYATILGVALGSGFRIDSIVLLGDPLRSLARLQKEHAPQKTLGTMNLDIRPLSSRKEVDEIIKLKRNYFTAHPEFCWFGAHDIHLNRQRDDLLESVRMKRREQPYQNHAWVLFREREFMGGFFYKEEKSHPQWGHSAGLDIILHPRIQRKGVVKTAYLHMLASMIDRKVNVYRGGTSQPAVMWLGHLMNRPLFSWVLRRRARFLPSHFGPYLPPSLRAVEGQKEY